MAYRIQCDSCDIERECTDWPDANRDARDHEAEYSDHWVTIHELQRA